MERKSRRAKTKLKELSEIERKTRKTGNPEFQKESAQQ